MERLSENFQDSLQLPNGWNKEEIIQIVLTLNTATATATTKDVSLPEKMVLHEIDCL